MVDNKGAIVLFADRKSVPGSNVVSACVSACVSDETQKTLEELCEKTGKKMSSLVRTLIEDSLELVKVVEA
jgi:hypothetical protein